MEQPVSETYTCSICKKEVVFLDLQAHHRTHLTTEDIQETQETVAEVREFTAEGSINVYEGQQRSGKTLTGTIFALEAYKQKKLQVFSTLGFRFPFTPLNFNKMKLDNASNPLTDGHAFIDELNFYLDARGAMSKLNKDFCKFLLQVKKQGLTLTGTTHRLNYLDIRFRQNYDLKIMPEVFPKYPDRPEVLKLTILNGPVTKRFNKTVKLKVEPFLGLYDTRHVFNAFEGAPSTPTTDNLKRIHKEGKAIKSIPKLEPFKL